MIAVFLGLFCGLIAISINAGVRSKSDTLALVTGRDGAIGIFLLDLPTRTLHRLTPPDVLAVNPNWSPDGKRILFTTVWENGTQRLMVVDADGDNLRLIQQFSDIFPLYGQPAWVNDGEAIVFIALRNGERRFFAVNLANLETHDVEARLIEEDDALAQAFLDHLNRTAQGQFSTPDGTRTITVTQVGGRWALILLNQESTAPQPQVLHYLPATAVTSGVMMAISSDGQQVAFRDVAEDGNLELFVLAVDARLDATVPPIQVTFGGGSSPVWQP
ncbi:MAG: hypothetical protein RLP44_27705 [Aggregatilineales bacterium]